MSTQTRLESPRVAGLAGVMRGCQSALMVADHVYYLAREAYEQTVLGGSADPVAAMFEYDQAIRVRAAALEASVTARTAYRAAQQEVTVRV